VSLPQTTARRLQFFLDRGALERLPSRWQLRVGWAAMLPVTLGESERERGRSRNTWAGQIPVRVPLQLLYCPAQFTSDTGLELPTEALVRHLLCVYHEDAFLGYDLQLLTADPGGLERLEHAAQAVVDGRARWAGLLRRVVSWPGYHAGLCTLARAARNGEYPDPLDLDPRFTSLVGFARFCCTMPDWPGREFYGFDLRGLARTRPPPDPSPDPVPESPDR